MPLNQFVLPGCQKKEQRCKNTMARIVYGFQFVHLEATAFLPSELCAVGSLLRAWRPSEVTLTCHRSYWHRRLGTCLPPACATFPTSSWRRTGQAGWEKTWWWVAAVSPSSSSRAGRVLSAFVVCVSNTVNRRRMFLAWCLLFFSRLFYWWPIHFLLTYSLGKWWQMLLPVGSCGIPDPIGRTQCVLWAQKWQVRRE